MSQQCIIWLQIWPVVVSNFAGTTVFFGGRNKNLRKLKLSGIDIYILFVPFKTLQAMSQKSMEIPSSQET